MTSGAAQELDPERRRLGDTVIFGPWFQVEYSNPTLPKIADDHRYAARSLRRYVESAVRERLRCRLSYTTPRDTKQLRRVGCVTEPEFN